MNNATRSAAGFPAALAVHLGTSPEDVRGRGPACGDDLRLGSECHPHGIPGAHPTAVLAPNPACRGHGRERGAAEPPCLVSAVAPDCPPTPSRAACPTVRSPGVAWAMPCPPRVCPPG